MTILELVDLAKNEKAKISQTIAEYNMIYDDVKSIIDINLLDKLNDKYKYELNKKEANQIKQADDFEKLFFLEIMNATYNCIYTNININRTEKRLGFR